MQSHATLTTEEWTTLCRHQNHEKLTLEACKDLGADEGPDQGVVQDGCDQVLGRQGLALTRMC